MATPALVAPPAPIEVIDDRLAGAQLLALEQMKALPLFEGLPPGKLQANVGGVGRRRLARGDIVCLEGDFGSSAFWIEEGEVEVYLAAGERAAKRNARGEGKNAKSGGLLRRLAQLIRREPESARRKATRSYIPIDAPVHLDGLTSVATLKTGDLFGEMACLSSMPRSATVRVKSEKLVVVELLQSVVKLLDESPKHQKRLQDDYKQRTLDNHLKAVPLLAGITQAFLDEVRPRVELLRFTKEKNPVLFKEGDAADGFYIVRRGFVKVTKRFAGGEVVLNYLAAPDCFGETALMTGKPRSATCSTLDTVEVVKIPTADFRRLLEQFPEIRTRLDAQVARRQRENELVAKRGASVDLEEFVAQGLNEGQNLLLLDLDKCTRCDECVTGCASAHSGVTRLFRDGLRYDKYLVATSCRSCRDPVCMPVCPVASIRRQETLSVVIEDWCIGCRKCEEACPFGNINMVEFLDETGKALERPLPPPVKKLETLWANTCDLCMAEGTPACVYSCPHDAAQRVDALQFFEKRLFPLRKSDGGR